jgi:citrate lyase subunit beta/citryl-CoA lyase
MGEQAAYTPRRSVLYMPSSNERALEKAKSLPVDGLILDLEDAVGPDHKDSARENACAAAASGDYGQREVTIRINGVGTQWHEADLAAAAEAGPAGVVVPKVGSADEVRALVAGLEAAGAPEHTRLWAMIETPEAVFNVREIASASPRLAVLVMGTNDLVKELHAEHVPGRGPLLTSLQLSLLAARGVGIALLDGV